MCARVQGTIAKWDSGAFEDDARRNKFLALMGAKKPGTAVAQVCRLVSHIHTYGLAKLTECTNHHQIDKQTAEQQQQKQSKLMTDLEKQYNTSMKANRSKGIGLGFS
jgi:hypothetical protein